MKTLFLNSIKNTESLNDGPGCRTVIYLQGCLFRCKGCHNPSTWKTNCGNQIKISDLVEVLNEKCWNKKLTISGGEPLLQSESLIELLKQLNGYDICLYTAFELEEVPKEVFKYIKYLKVGKFDISKMNLNLRFVGSTNQRFLEVKDGKIVKEWSIKKW